MSAKYAVHFGVMAVAAATVSVTVASGVVWHVLFCWIALAFGIVAIAYASGQPRLLMKRQDGSQPIWAWLILGPYFVLARFSFWLYRIANQRRPAVAEVAPGLWFARRLTAKEARISGVEWFGVLDLAAEFPRADVMASRYYSLPLLDGAAPAELQLREAIAWINEQLKQGPVLVHCALGHGRTGSAVLGWLLLRGHVPDVRSGISRLRALRSGFDLSTAQAACVKGLTADRPIGPPATAQPPKP